MAKMEKANIPSDSIFNKNVGLIILVASLGYFVDIYDLLLFSIVRISSLKGIGILNPQELTDKGAMLINIQMAGMIIGGFTWGILGDKKGRLTVLFGSILLYSISNILNGFVHTIFEYGTLRFFAGFGLAGELGAGITLVAESMKKENRGYGTMLVATVGILGAVMASYIAKIFDWRMAYWVGGGLGILLLIMRIGVSESSMFKKNLPLTISKGNILDLLGKRERLLRYFYTSFIALPIWFIIGILVTFGPEFGLALKLKGVVLPGIAISFTYFGASIGNLLSGFFSQIAKSRRKILAIFIPLSAIMMGFYLTQFNGSVSVYYLICSIMGFSTGYWVLFVTVGAEQFGTNLRATAATSLPNIARGYVIPLLFLFQAISHKYSPDPTAILKSALTVGAISIILSLIGLWKIKETYGLDLDYLEE